MKFLEVIAGYERMGDEGKERRKKRNKRKKKKKIERMTYVRIKFVLISK